MIKNNLKLKGQDLLDLYPDAFYNILKDWLYQSGFFSFSQKRP